MLELKFVSSIAERDIDLLILEELSVSTEFREWFSSRVFGEAIYQSQLGTWHSVSDAQLGESDIIFLFEAIDGPRTAILIENKIDAPPQPKQGERYRLRGEKGLKDGYWEKFKTCVIAPSKYLYSTKHVESYDAEVSYEEIFAYFQSRSSRSDRFPYKAKILQEGIEQNRRGYQPEYNEEITKFVAEYFAYSVEEFAQLEMQKAKPRPAGSTWIMFNPKSLPKEINLVHQLTAGLVKVFFNGQAEIFENLKCKYSSKLPENASIRIAGKSVSISIKVPKIDPISQSFFEQKEKVTQALHQLSLLEKLVKVGSEPDRSPQI
ncbi:hypothetical protein [Shewanella putrefaciens]|uniref:hypothetical protein n=1 Tax=Shewanella putrefaciens TaxID=24 RepID=UPI0018E7783E|nr:hypothetical protein [Shewanella putrefaciens]